MKVKANLPNSTAPAGSINHTFKYRRIFAEAPTNKTEKTWEIMFPSKTDPFSYE